MNRVIIDAGPLVALFDKQDADHQICQKILADVRGQLITSSAVLTEVFHFLKAGSRSWLGVQEFVKQGNVSVVDLDSIRDFTECFDLMAKYQDNPMDFADATLVMLAGINNTKDVFTLDVNDFSSYRIRNGFNYIQFNILGVEAL